ncbi:hypothetical protein J6590_005377, partial [Homalodisca vitripennis]
YEKTRSNRRKCRFADKEVLDRRLKESWDNCIPLPRLQPGHVGKEKKKNKRGPT